MTFDTQKRLGARDPKTPEAAPDYWAPALAEIFAMEAAADQAILAFRERVLPNGLVPPQDIPDWIARTATDDGPSTMYVTVPLSDDGKPLFDPSPKRTPVSKYPMGWKQVLLSYAGPSDKAVSVIPVRSDGTLGELWHLATKISDRYG